MGKKFVRKLDKKTKKNNLRVILLLLLLVGSVLLLANFISRNYLSTNSQARETCYKRYSESCVGGTQKIFGNCQIKGNFVATCKSISSATATTLTGYCCSMKNGKLSVSSGLDQMARNGMIRKGDTPSYSCSRNGLIYCYYRSGELVSYQDEQAKERQRASDAEKARIAGGNAARAKADADARAKQLEEQRVEDMVDKRVKEEADRRVKEALIKYAGCTYNSTETICIINNKRTPRHLWYKKTGMWSYTYGASNEACNLSYTDAVKALCK